MLTMVRRVARVGPYLELSPQKNHQGSTRHTTRASRGRAPKVRDESREQGTVSAVRNSSQIGARIAGGYLAGTGIGAGALTALPSTPEGGLGFVDALFTAASAVTLTGLSVADTSRFSGLGQAIVFLLIAFGAIGVAITTAGLVLLLGRARWSSRQSLNADVSANADQQRSFLLYVLASVATATLVGGLALRVAGMRWWDSFFYALSAFANAGFSTLPDSLTAVSSPAIALISLLVLVGGLGYPVTFELIRRRRDDTEPLSSTTHLTLLATLGLLVTGALVLGSFEWGRDETLGTLPLPRRLAALLALTVMPRSGGFNVTDTGELADGSLLTTIFLMFIGAGPAATGGGIKTTGFAVLVIALIAAGRGRETAHAGRFAISPRLVNHVIAVTLVLAGTVMLVTLVLSLDRSMTVALFDATSAVTTTGLSAGEPATSAPSKIALTLGMLIGRLAPMLLAVRLMGYRKALVRPAEREIIVT